MAKILIVYGTTEGQTRRIAESMATQSRGNGHEIALYDCVRRPRDLAIGDFNAVVIAASVHQQEHQEAVANFVMAHLDHLNSVPTLFVSVSLSAAFEDGTPEAQAYVDRFLADTNWRPTRVAMIAGALRYSEYDYFKQQVVNHLVLKGRKVEGPSGDYEFTDWDALAREVDEFTRTISG